LAPPELPGFNATMTLSETQASHHPLTVLKFPSLTPGFPSSRKSPSLHAVLTTPVDRSGAYRFITSALPRRVLPKPLWPSHEERTVGIHVKVFRGLLKLHSRYGLQICSPT
jgi:hypothetical protein